MQKPLTICNVVEKNNMELRLRKPHTAISLKSHTILTDDVFTYVEFFFKTHNRILKDEAGKKIEQDFTFYWEQAKNFYKAAKMLPIESSPLPSYYSMLNAAKAMLLYKTTDVASTMQHMGAHGLHEGNPESQDNVSLCNIGIRRDERGVFPEFSRQLDPSFEEKWKSSSKKEPSPFSVKDLLRQLAFIHRAYCITYEISRTKELFIPLISGKSPAMYRCSDGKNYLVVDLDKKYFRETAKNIPGSVLEDIPKIFREYQKNDFRLISKHAYNQHDFRENYSEVRKHFSYISSDKRLWYLKKEKIESEVITNFNSLSVILAVMHRFSEIVRYKPEQMVKLLHGKENWLIREFVILSLDQFFDEIACEITGQDIMGTRVK